jgi:hypothetical protein
MDWGLAQILPNVEDAFGFAVPDADADGFDTAGQLHDYVLAKRFGENRDDCLDCIAFHKVQRAMTSVLELPRDAMQASTRLSAIFPNRRRRVWRAVEKRTGFHLPILRRPQRVVMIATLGAIGLGIAVPLAFGLKPLHGANAAAVISIIVFGYLFYWLTKVCEYELPPDVGTVGQLAKATLARNYQAIVAESKKTIGDAEVWETLQRIIGKEFGIPPEEVAEGTELSTRLIAS